MSIKILFGLLLAMPLGAAAKSNTQGIDPNIPYNKKNVTTFECSIKEVLSIDWPHGAGSSTGICLRVNSKKKNHYIIVAPFWHVGGYMKFNSGDVITVQGARDTAGKKNVVLARWIKKDGRTLHLRNVTGIPFWDSVGPMPKRRKQGRGRGKGGSRGGGRGGGKGRGM